MKLSILAMIMIICSVMISQQSRVFLHKESHDIKVEKEKKGKFCNMDTQCEGPLGRCCKIGVPSKGGYCMNSPCPL